jgi:hypothetical protein
MATINYNGMELEEFTTPQIFDPPQEMLVIDELDDKPIKKKVAAILATGYCHNVVATDETFWQSCFRIPDPPKPRRATWLEVARWCATGNGLVYDTYRDSIDTGIKFKSFEGSESIMDEIKVRKWSDTEWHEPTVDYIRLEDVK